MVQAVRRVTSRRRMSSAYSPACGSVSGGSAGTRSCTSAEGQSPGSCTGHSCPGTHQTWCQWHGGWPARSLRCHCLLGGAPRPIDGTGRLGRCHLRIFLLLLIYLHPHGLLCWNVDHEWYPEFSARHHVVCVLGEVSVIDLHPHLFSQNLVNLDVTVNSLTNLLMEREDCEWKNIGYCKRRL